MLFLVLFLARSPQISRRQRNWTSNIGELKNTMARYVLWGRKKCARNVSASLGGIELRSEPQHALKEHF
jgi:hypothetical protein